MLYKKYVVVSIKYFKVENTYIFMDYNVEIDTSGSSKTSKHRSYAEYILSGIGAVGMTCLAMTSFNYFHPAHFGEWKGDIPFSADGGLWRGYVRCGDGAEKTVVVKTRDGEIISLEKALSTIPEELGRRDGAREDVMEQVDKCDCSK